MFDELIGNKTAKNSLARMVEKGRLAHSFLFAGDEGVGKKAFAMELIRSLVCVDLRNGDPCGKCRSCVRAVKFAFPKPDDRDEFKKVIFSEHPDVGMVTTPARMIAVDAIRDLEREANFRPFEARARAFLIDDAEKMNDASSNALLKTLEEPAETTYIFLITSRPDSLLSTIRSRCQLIRFAPVRAEEIEPYLIARSGMDIKDAALCSRLANGSVSRALSIDLKDLRARRDAMVRLVDAAVKRDNGAIVLKISEKFNDASNKDDFEPNLDILQTLIHDLWLSRMGEPESRMVNVDIAGDLAAISSQAEAGRFSGWLGEIETMREGLEVNINRKIATDALFMHMAAG